MSGCYMQDSIHELPYTKTHDLEAPPEINIVRRYCRICLEENNEEYVTPCMCSGSIGSVHANCMKMFIYKQLSGGDIKKPSDLMRVACEMCNRQIRFEYEIKPRVDCCNCKNQKKTKAWFLLLILMVVFGMLLAALLIVVFFYYTDENGKALFKDYAAGIWILIGLIPLVAVALGSSIYYFIAYILYGRIHVTRILNRGDRPSTKFKVYTFFDYDRFTIEE